MRRLERNAWWVLAAFAGLSFLFGLGDLLGGAPDNTLAVTGQTNAQLAAQSSEAYRLLQAGVRAGGLHLMFIGVLVAAIVQFGFRQNQHWAWWAMWSLPVFTASLVILHLAVGVAPGQTVPAPVISGAILTVLAAAAILASAPGVFRRPSVE